MLGHLTSAGGSAQVSTAERRFGTGSAYFDGSDGGMGLVPNGRNTLKLPATDDQTMELWFKTENEMPCPSCTLPGVAMLSSRKASYGYQTHGITLGLFKDGQTLWVYSYQTQSLHGVDIVTKSEWHHFGFVRQGNTEYLYLDGKFQNSRTSTHHWNFPEIIMRLEINTGCRKLTAYLISLEIHNNI